MIYEFRTYDLKPGSLPTVLKNFEEGYKHRTQFSELVAFWYTDIGPLNQIIHVWPYESVAERERIRAEAAKHPNWPPNILDHIVHMESEICHKFPCSPDLKPGNWGPVYEMRYYQVTPGKLPAIMDGWEKALPKRLEVSPLAGVFYTDTGALSKMIHIWPYSSTDERARIRKHCVDEGIWPPPGGAANLSNMKNKIMLPAPFSPMQ